MKAKILSIFLVFFSMATVGQTKLGSVNSNYILSLMPEAMEVLKKTQAYGKKLDSAFSTKLDEYKKKVDTYKKEEKTLGLLAKKTAEKEILDMEVSIKKYQENGTKLLELKQEELMRPLYKKVRTAIEQIAKSRGYTQILTTTGNDFAYIDPKHDITELVIKKLNLKKPVKK